MSSPAAALSFALTLAVLAGLGGVAAGRLAAAEDDPARPRGEPRSMSEPKPAALDKAAEAQLRALHLEAVKRGDLWTVMQLEAAARQGEVKLRSVLAGTSVYGDPLFAFPEPIVRWRDRGDDVVVVTTTRICRCAPDGRPLDLPAMLPRTTWHSAFNDAASVVATVATPADGKTMQFFAAALDGKILLDRSVPAQGASPNGAPCVADDGSAIAIEATKPVKGGASTNHLVVCRAAGEVAHSATFGAPQAIGPEARWIACLDAGKPVMVTDGGGDPLPLRELATGAGCACMLDPDGAPLVIGRDGKALPLVPPIGLGADASVRTVGGWLALCSGASAKTAAHRDAFGATVRGGAAQPPTIALYRWRELAAAPASAAPAMVVENVLSPASGEAAALFVWRDNQLDVLDLAHDAPASRPLYTAPAAIAGVRTADFAIEIALVGGGQVVIDQLGRELAVLATPGVVVHPQWSIQREPKATRPLTAVRLDADPAERAIVPLAAEDDGADPWQVGYDPIADQLLGWRSGGEWAPFDPRTGARLPVDGDGARRSPERIDEQPGRFHADPGGARLRRKRAQREDIAAQQWEPVDAWRVQRTLLVLDHDGELIATGGRKGWRVIGRCRRADRLAHDQDVPVVVDNAGKPVAVLTAGPALSDALPARLGTPDELPAGAWRVDNSELSFFTPKSGVLVWNTERLGFTPRRLRCPDGGGMLIVTGSLVIEIDATAAKLVGKPKG